MCNLYKLELAGQTKLFGKSTDEIIGNLPPSEVYPGGQGVVMTPAGDLKTMTWGFPLKQVSNRTGKPIKPKAVNNARSDKLTTPFWKGSAANPAQRCLIPVNAFAEAIGQPGTKKRAWLSIADQDTFVCAGIWRNSVEWGDVYSMVMTDARPDMLEIHDRMPVILKPENYDQWLSSPLEEAIGLCVPFAHELSVDRTDDPWLRR